MSAYWSPTNYLDSAVRDVLTGQPHQLDATVAHAGLLIAACGAAADSDRLLRRWRHATQRPATVLVRDPARDRAWAMLLANRSSRPEWAAELIPMDLDEAELEHQRYLRSGEPPLPDGLAAGAAATRIVSGIAELLEGASEPDALRGLAAEAEALAARGALSAASSTLTRWARKAAAQARPEVAMLAGCRNLAALLGEGTLAAGLDLPAGWTGRCAGELAAALDTRFPSSAAQYSWRELLTRIMRSRLAVDEADLPAPASPHDLDEAEHRLGIRLPDDYRDFLLTCDGLDADVVFPRLLSSHELVRTGAAISISATATEHGESTTISLVEREGGWRTVEWDSTLGLTEYHAFRDLLEHHLRLLEDG